MFFYALIFSSGFATLSWELIWQIKSTLLLGASALSAAITLAIIMGGMSIGGFIMGYVIRETSALKAIRLYGLFEVMIGLLGLSLNLNTGIFVVFIISALCMGATLPTFQLIAKQYQSSLTKLYSLNTLGAALGVLFAAFFLIPAMGIAHTTAIIAIINLSVGVLAWLFTLNNDFIFIKIKPITNNPTAAMTWQESVIVFITGFATFSLEIAWFRSLSATFQNTADIFAMMLACVLIALYLAAKKVTVLKRAQKLLGIQICVAGILILLTTPLIERLDLFLMFSRHTSNNALSQNTLLSYNLGWLLHSKTLLVNGLGIVSYALQMLIIFFITCLFIIPSMYFLGIALPWILDNQHSARALGKLYAINTLASVLGALGAAWILLPMLGFAKTAWLAGVLVILAGILILPYRKQCLWGVLGFIAFSLAIHFETGIGITRVQGFFANAEEKPAKVLGYFEGPAATLSAVQYQDGARALLINSSSASAESGRIAIPNIHSMVWMGHLPMLLHAHPKNALVICFGSGQTANAVRKENPESLDIVDINPQVFKLAPYFKSNENVLADPRVKTIVMDGRLYLQNTHKTYDIITLDPMPPTTVGVNALYSQEFYQLARKKLNADGIIAQWLPFQLIAPHYAASIAKTFISVFPNAILWIDPVSKNGILLGTKAEKTPLATTWPGFTRNAIQRNLSSAEVLQSAVLNPTQLAAYGQYGEIISDDNQLLNYGKALYVYMGLIQKNFELLHRINPKINIL